MLDNQKAGDLTHKSSDRKEENTTSGATNGNKTSAYQSKPQTSETNKAPFASKIDKDERDQSSLKDQGSKDSTPKQAKLFKEGSKTEMNLKHSNQLEADKSDVDQRSTETGFLIEQEIARSASGNSNITTQSQSKVLQSQKEKGSSLKTDLSPKDTSKSPVNNQSSRQVQSSKGSMNTPTSVPSESDRATVSNQRNSKDTSPSKNTQLIGENSQSGLSIQNSSTLADDKNNAVHQSAAVETSSKNRIPIPALDLANTVLQEGNQMERGASLKADIPINGTQENLSQTLEKNRQPSEISPNQQSQNQKSKDNQGAFGADKKLHQEPEPTKAKGSTREKKELNEFESALTNDTQEPQSTTNQQKRKIKKIIRKNNESEKNEQDAIHQTQGGNMEETSDLNQPSNQQINSTGKVGVTGNNQSIANTNKISLQGQKNSSQADNSNVGHSNIIETESLTNQQSVLISNQESKSAQPKKTSKIVKKKPKTEASGLSSLDQESQSKDQNNLEANIMNKATEPFPLESASNNARMSNESEQRRYEEKEPEPVQIGDNSGEEASLLLKGGRYDDLQIPIEEAKTEEEESPIHSIRSQPLNPLATKIVEQQSQKNNQKKLKALPNKEAAKVENKTTAGINKAQNSPKNQKESGSLLKYPSQPDRIAEDVRSKDLFANSADTQHENRASRWVYISGFIF